MFKYFAVFLFLLILIGFLLPDKPLIPVQDAGQKDWHKETFWYEPWGSSGVHKGIDIIARHGTPVLAPTTLLILYHLSSAVLHVSFSYSSLSFNSVCYHNIFIQLCILLSKENGCSIF